MTIDISNSTIEFADVTAIPACRKRRQNGAVSRNNRKKGGPVSV